MWEKSSPPSDETWIKLRSPLDAISVSRLLILSSSSLLKPFPKRFLLPPDTAMNWSLSAISAVWPDTWARLSAYCFAKVLISPMGEYFFKMISPSLSVNISSGSLSRIRNVLLISFGITIRPKSSILLTIPVAFISFPPSTMLKFCTSICKRWHFIP